ncbi:hypothetical protein MSAN_02330100 [Mycena sanguinolenta]|uniref:Uncharacterized protein n=1 Tax=Mycena sanguinolenta TaxID=230812 RepID=A0A8H6X8B8_9AGAR|nr:hypothetical protein MSAN_02330100 [Mycena sanguinolenta]
MMPWTFQRSTTRGGREYSAYAPPSVFGTIQIPNIDIRSLIAQGLIEEKEAVYDIRAPEASDSHESIPVGNSPPAELHNRALETPLSAQITVSPPPSIEHPTAPSPLHDGSPALNRKSLSEKAANLGARRRRAAKRHENKQEAGYSSRRNQFISKLLAQAKVCETPLNMANLGFDSSGYTAVNEPAGMRQTGRPSAADAPLTLAEYLDAGFNIFRWNGRDPHLLADVNGHVFADLVGRPSDAGYDKAVERFHARMVKESAGVVWTPKETDTHRGVSSINEGWFFSKEQRKLFWLCGGQNGLAARLRHDDDMKRIASFVSSAYAYWFPKLYENAHERIHCLLEHVKSDLRTFPTSAFTCVAFNFGPQVSTTLHRDWTDMAGDMCAVVALGNFDPTKGGHLVLWELKLLVEFPPGSLILFPSALISHANIPVGPGETRTSVVQYTPGMLCRFVENNFRTEKQIKKRSKAEYRQVLAAKANRYVKAIRRLLTLQELGVQPTP